MTGTAELLERELIEDLSALDERFADEEFSTELYRALTNNVWRKRRGAEGHVSFSWGRAEQLVNDLRAHLDQAPLTLALTGGEGVVSELVEDEIGRLGWSARPLNTSRHDDRHLDQPESAPPVDHGERQAPVAGGEALEQAHEEADASLRGEPHAPPPGTQGMSPGS